MAENYDDARSIGTPIDVDYVVLLDPASGEFIVTISVSRIPNRDCAGMVAEWLHDAIHQHTDMRGDLYDIT